MARIVVFGNEKGGSGKSTTAIHVLIALCYEEKRVGVLDLDLRQQSLFRFLENTSINTNYLNLIFPKKDLLYISMIIILFFLPDFIIDKLSLHPGYRNYSANINISEVLDFASFRYIKLSELHELLFCIYLFYHSLFFKKIYSS